MNLVFWKRRKQFWQQFKKLLSKSKQFALYFQKRFYRCCFDCKLCSTPKWFSVRLQCSFDSRTGTFLTKIRRNFCLKTQTDKKTVTLFSGNQIFNQIVICACKVHFGQLGRTFCAKSVRSSFSNLVICWKNWKMFEKDLQICALQRQNAIFCQ